MKAIYYEKYGPPEVLRQVDIESPVPEDNEVLVRVRAASVNAWDWELLRGKPFWTRIGGLFHPKYRILGADMSGVVEAAGSNVRCFRKGDAVFGDLCASGWGAFAEYVSVPEDALIRKPDAISFEEAAAIPQAGVMALQGLRDTGKTGPGQKVLINGAGGGVGTLAIQLAKLSGADVTAVDSAEKLDMLLENGAGHVIDYTTEDFTHSGRHYDLILDVVVNRTASVCAKSLATGGTYVFTGGTMGSAFGFLLAGPWYSRTARKNLHILVHKPNKDLGYLAELAGTGRLKPVIGARYPLSGVPDALQDLGAGRISGKAVINVSSGD